MAQQGVQLDRDQFCCSICLDLLNDPVTIPCGHSYCMGCIKHCWDQDDQEGIYSCPQCRMTFIPRPVLKKNNIIAEVIEQLTKTGLQAAAPDLCHAGPGDVACDFCTGRKQKAVKSCLVCLASYCEIHLQPHYDVAPLKKHQLAKASAHLQENICSRHDRILDVFCRTDQQCICYLCSMDEHKGHDTVSAAAERTGRQKELGRSQQEIQQSIQEREKKLKELQQAVDSLSHSADEAVKDSERIFTELIGSMETRCSEVKKLIRDQQKTAVTQTEDLQKRLKQEIADLRRRDTELEQLSHTEDHIHLLQSCPSLSSPSESTDYRPITISIPLQYFADVTEAVSNLRDKLECFLKEQWLRISTTVNAVELLPLPEPKLPCDAAGFLRAQTNRLKPKTRADFLQYSCQITLDPNTAHKRVCLSKGNRRARLIDKKCSYPNNAERFSDLWQVLSREGLTGRCYWEVEWSGWVYITVSYYDISRTGPTINCGLGYNPKSWALAWQLDFYSFRHNKFETRIPGPQSSRIGVYLDHEAGTLSFYSVSDTMTLLHRVQTTFTQPLYPGLWFQKHPSYAELCELK